MFDKLHVMYIITFIHSFIQLLECYLFIYSFNLVGVYLFIYLIKHFIHLTFEYNKYFVLAEIE